jgi:hypothetical protein
VIGARLAALHHAEDGLESIHRLIKGLIYFSTLCQILPAPTGAGYGVAVPVRPTALVIRHEMGNPLDPEKLSARRGTWKWQRRTIAGSNDLSWRGSPIVRSRHRWRALKANDYP